jgi:hypothetical protein
MQQEQSSRLEHATHLPDDSPRGLIVEHMQSNIAHDGIETFIGKREGEGPCLPVETPQRRKPRRL